MITRKDRSIGRALIIVRLHVNVGYFYYSGNKLKQISSEMVHRPAERFLGRIP